MTVSVIPQYKPLIAEFKDIDKLSSADFEIFVRDLFVASGWTDAEITQTGKEFKHGDGGVDMVGSIFSPGKGGESLLLR